jgi:hypothetical protein
MNAFTGQLLKKMTFGRMPRPFETLKLGSGELVTTERTASAS